MKKLCLFIFSLLLILAAGCQLDTTEIERETELEYITVDTSGAKKLTYHVGEDFDATGIRIFGYYSNGVKKEEDLSLAKFIKVDTSVVNPELYVGVTYNNRSASFPITVREVTPNGIKIKTCPKKMFYHAGDSLDLDGIVAVVINSDESEGKILGADDLSCEQTVKTVNTYSYPVKETFSIEYTDGLKTDLSVYVLTTDVYLSDIELDTNKIPSNYRKGSDFDFSDVTLNCYYSNGVSPQSLPITDFNISPYSIKDFDVGKQTVTVAVKKQSDEEAISFDIKITDGYVVGATLETNKDYYYEGEEIEFIRKDAYTFKTIVSKDNNTFTVALEQDLYSNLKYSYKPSNENDFDKLSDAEKLAEFDSASLIMTPLEIKGNGLQKIYFYYKYHNEFGKKGDPEYIIYRWAWNISVWDAKLNSITATFKPKAGTSVPLESSPDLKFEQHYGDWEIKGHLSNGTIVTIPPESCEYNFKEDNNETHSNTRKIEVTYKDIRQKDARQNYKEFEASATIVYGDPIVTSTELKKSPDKTKYGIGDKLDLTGMQYILHKSNGENETVNYNNDSGLTTSLEDNRVTVSDDVKVYISSEKNIYLTIPIEVVEDKIESIRILKKNGAMLKFRKGDTECDFSRCFEIYPVYNNSAHTPEPLTENLTFSLVSAADNKCTLYVIYNDGTKNYYASYQSASADGEITLLEPEPLIVEIKAPETIPAEYEDYIKKATYTVYYKDGSEKDFLGSDKLKEEGFNVDSDNKEKLIISYTGSEKDYKGDGISFKQILNLSHVYNNTVCKITIEIREDGKVFYWDGEKPVLEDFNVQAWFYNRNNKNLTEGVKITDDFDEYEGDRKKTARRNVIVEYLNFEATCEVTVNPSPSSGSASSGAAD